MLAILTILLLNICYVWIKINRYVIHLTPNVPYPNFINFYIFMFGVGIARISTGKVGVGAVCIVQDTPRKQ